VHLAVLFGEGVVEFGEFAVQFLLVRCGGSFA
jgi:hypothetical protein